MRQHLLPVWAYGRFVSSAQDLCLAPGEWWNQEALRYPHALISYLHWQQPFEFPEGSYIFGDSGGFALRARNRPRKIDPIDVLHWQAELCTVGCILDLPPRGGDWGRSLRVTVDHTRWALPEYERLRGDGSRFRWWGVLQGDDDAQMMEWYNAISDVYPFSDDGEGWAIYPGPRPSPLTVARSMRILKTLGITRAHFLMCTAQNVIATMLALAPQAGLELLTYDSAYAIKTGLNRFAFQPRDDGISFRLIREQGDERHTRDFLLHECQCDACVFMRERSTRVVKARHELEGGRFGGWWSGWVQIHNLCIQQKLTDAQAREADADPDRLLRAMLNEKDRALVMRTFDGA